jgi:N-acetylglutamate synthase
MMPDPAPFEIAHMLPGDYDQVFALWEATEGVGLNESDTRVNVERFLLRNPSLSKVARIDGRIVGAVLCGHDGRRGYLHHLAVAKPFRRFGVGRGLVEACLADLAAQHIIRCNIFLYTDNAAGQDFWRAAGWNDRADLCIMQRATTPGVVELPSRRLN